MTPNRLTLIQGQLFSDDASPAISGDGSLIAFATTSALLPTDTTAGSDDIYVRNLQTGQLTLASWDADTGAVGGVNLHPVLSATGAYVAFEHTALGGKTSILVTDTATNQVVTGSTNALGTSANGASFDASLSANGQYLAFISAATNLSFDFNGVNDGFLKNLVTGDIINISTRANDTQANRATTELEVSGDGSVVVFTTAATNLIEGAKTAVERVYLKNVATGALSLVSVSASGEQAALASKHISVSDNGRYVTFSTAYRLNEDAPSGATSIYRKDMQTGALMLISTDANGHSGKGSSDMAVISADGRYVMFESTSDLVPGDGNGKNDIFIKDTITGSITRLSAGASEEGSLSHSAFARSSLDAIFLSSANGGATGADLILGTLGSGFASVSNATYNGDAAKNTLLGGAGNDSFTGNGGNDLIDGGAGKDIAYYSGKLSDYALSKTDAGLIVTDLRGVDGIDTIGNVETLRFADFSVSTDIDGTPGQLYRLYQAAFGRVPDAPGLGYWIAQLEKGMTLNEAARQFFMQQEAKDLYGASPDDMTLVTALYANVHHRVPTTVESNYWLWRLDQGSKASDILVEFSESPENYDALAGTMESGFLYMPW